MSGENSHDVESFLNVGLDIVFDTDLNNPNTGRHEMRLLGWKTNKFLIMEFKDRGNNRSRVFSLKPCALRFLSMGRPCATQVSLIDTFVESGTNLFRVSWPQKVVFKTIRTGERLEANFESFVHLGNEMEIPGQISNISLGGIQLYVPIMLNQDQNFRCSIVLPSGVRLEEIECVARSVRASGEGCIAGCMFVDLSSKIEEALNFYLMISSELADASADENKCVVIVDDHETASDLKKCLEKEAYQPLVLSDLVQVISWIGSTYPLAMMVNVKKSELNILEFCKIIRGSELSSTTDIVLYGDDETTLKVLQESTKAQGFFTATTSAAAVLQQLSPEKTDSE